MFGDITLSGGTSLCVSAILGALVGLEREIHGRPAGFRTHLLVSVGACLFVLVSIDFYRRFGTFTGTLPVGVDPGRVAAQVVTGIGFLGAGAIIREGASVRGLTTAACLWVVAAIGVACGVGMYGTASLVTVIALSSLLALKKVEEFLAKDVYCSLDVVTVDREGMLEQIRQRLKGCDVFVINLTFTKDKRLGETTYSIHIRHRGRELPCSLVESIEGIDGVLRITIG
ncbi:MAG: MgtC/SapB family protein [Desulfuromonadia bacterium]